MFPEEIIAEIFSWLPAKSIGRFRCASKPWKSLLSQPQFIKTHLDRTKHRPIVEESLILLSPESGSLYSTQLNNAHHLLDEITLFAKKLTFDDHRFTFFYHRLVSCDGLILVSNDDKKLLLINPTTREIKEMPSLSLPFDLKPLSFGLGYDSVNDDYKVVLISCIEKTFDAQMFVHVYSVRNGTWKRVDDSPFKHFPFEDTSAVFVDGFIHWVAMSSDRSFVIAAFDLVDEKFYEVPLSSLADTDKVDSEESESDYSEVSDSDNTDEEFMFDDLVVLGGCLCAFPLCISDTCHNLFVAMMKEYGAEESWTKIPIKYSDSEIRPLCLLGKEQMVMMICRRINEVLVVYNMKEATLKDIVVHGFPGKIGVGGSYFESLVSPHCSNEAVTTL
uniref:F-box domain-containing protein n=2 Tax=Chenopodium quinoa TaxID=63459 RepID=A0A803MNF2_CHEQI